MKYACFDTTGKVQEWVAAGRGLRVWVSHDLGAGRSDMLTPGDVTDAPHWAYPFEASKFYATDDVVFYRRATIVKEWNDTPAGWAAAARYVGEMSHNEQHEVRDAPIGEVRTEYTTERHCYHTEAKVRMNVTPPAMPYNRALSTRFVVAVVRWIAITPREVGA